MYCARCGAALRVNIKYCEKCGAPVSASKTSASNWEKAVKTEAQKEKRAEILAGILVAIIVLTVAVIATVTITSMSINIKNRDNIVGKGNGGKGMVLEKKNNSQAEQTVLQPTPTPSPTPDLSYEKIDYYANGYSAVRDNIYSYICPYPQEFVLSKVYNGYSADDLNSEISINMGAYSNTGAEDARALLAQFKVQCGVEFSYSDAGERWYAASYEQAGYVYYRKCLVNDLNVAYFDVVCPKENLDSVRGHIDYMEANFKFE